MRKCPKCGSETRQHKIGFTPAGSQRYKCQECDCKYTPEPKLQGYPEELRQQAVRMYLDGLNVRRIDRLLGVDPVSVMNWVKAYAETVEDAPVPDSDVTVEMDELYTFVVIERVALRLVSRAEWTSSGYGLVTLLWQA